MVELRRDGSGASTVEIVPRAETDLPQLFVLASMVFKAIENGELR